MDEREPPCPHALRCGGCAEMGWTDAAQLDRKRRAAEQALRRPLDAAHASPRAVGYRARVSMAVDLAGRPGFHRAGSREPVHVDACLVAREPIAALLPGLPPLPRGCARLELRTDGQRVVAAVQARPGVREADLAEALAGWRPAGLHGLAVGSRVVFGDPTLWLEVCGIRHQLGPGTFFQVNLEVNAALCLAVRDAALAVGPRGLLDLYAGCGNLGLPIAAAGVRAVLIESGGSAARDARRTAARHGLATEVRTGDAGAFRAGDAFFDVAVLDPPRAGAPGVLAALLTTKPRRVIYVSCNPRALGRDLELVAGAGYRVGHLALYDMFPQTDHAELLCVIDPAQAPPPPTP